MRHLRECLSFCVYVCVRACACAKVTRPTLPCEDAVPPLAGSAGVGVTYTHSLIQPHSCLCVRCSR